MLSDREGVSPEPCWRTMLARILQRHEQLMNERPETVAPGRILNASTAVTLPVATTVAVIAFDVHELLDAPAVDGLSGVDVPF